MAINALILEESFERLAQFVTHSDGNTIHIEILSNSHVFEIQSISAIILTSHRDVLAIENPWIALAVGRKKRFHESVMLIIMKILTNNVTSQNARVIFFWLHDAIAAKDCFQVDAKRRVAVPTLLLIIIFRWRG